MFSLPRHLVLLVSKEKIFLIILVYLPNCCQMGVTIVIVTGWIDIFFFFFFGQYFSRRLLFLWQILLPKCGRCYCHHWLCLLAVVIAKDLWLMLLPHFMADVIAICGWCFLPLLIVFILADVIAKADVFTFCGRWNSHFLCDGLMLLPCGRWYCHFWLECGQVLLPRWQME